MAQSGLPRLRATPRQGNPEGRQPGANRPFVGENRSAPLGHERSQIALACSAVAACSRDGTAQVPGRRLRRQTGTPARVGPAAVCTSERCTEQPRVEPVLRGWAAAATRLPEGYAANPLIKNRRGRRRGPSAELGAEG